MLGVFIPWMQTYWKQVKVLVVCRVGNRKPCWSLKLKCRKSLASDMDNWVRSPGVSQNRHAVSSEDSSISICDILLPIARLYFYVPSTQAEDSDPTPVNPCYDGSHMCDTTARCHPGTGVDYTCECASGYQGDGRNCVGKSYVLVSPSCSPCSSSALPALYL